MLKLKLERLTNASSAELVATVAEALHYAHKQGLVHRDVKPGNILLDTDGTPFVVDFGLALREENIGKGPRYAGTPVYMSPEQARGEGHRVDGRSDIFGLGVVLYEMLVGRRPFQSETQQELLKQITTMEAKPPRQFMKDVNYTGLKPEHNWTERKSHFFGSGYPGLPVHEVSWFDSVMFCNWLSKRLGLDPPCYKIEETPDEKGRDKQYKVTLDPAADGIRLLTTEEWGYACRAQTTTGFSFGNRYAAIAIVRARIASEWTPNGLLRFVT